ncbi:MAG: hypothetical protein ABSH16_10645 [Sedimentisphaerales bacterium]
MTKTLFAVILPVFILTSCGTHVSLSPIPTDTFIPKPTDVSVTSIATVEPTPILTSSRFGPEAVWNIDGNISKYQNCFNNSSTSIDCIISLMQSSGASSQAIEFTRMMQGIAFMSSFKEFGIVDLAEITYPARANNNVEYVLINGNPQIVYVEVVYKVDITNDSNYPVLQQRYPNIRIEGGENSFINMEQIPQGGQRFIFGCALVDGCHACQTDKSAYIAFNFEGTGQFDGMKLLYIK